MTELLKLLREMLASQEALLRIAVARQEAMRIFDIAKLPILMEQERLETQRGAELMKRRQLLVHQFAGVLGNNSQPTVSEIAARCGEPAKTQLLVIAGQIRTVVGELDRYTRINAKVSETVVKGLAKVMKVMTGMAQHAGLYMRNGRKAAIRGVHMLEITA